MGFTEGKILAIDIVSYNRLKMMKSWRRLNIQRSVLGDYLLTLKLQS